MLPGRSQGEAITCPFQLPEAPTPLGWWPPYAQTQQSDFSLTCASSVTPLTRTSHLPLSLFLCFDLPFPLPHPLSKEMWWLKTTIYYDLPCSCGLIRLSSPCRLLLAVCRCSCHQVRNRTQYVRGTKRGPSSFPACSFPPSGIFSNKSQSFSNCFSPLELRFQLLTTPHVPSVSLTSSGNLGGFPQRALRRVSRTGVPLAAERTHVIIGGPPSFGKEKTKLQTHSR